MKLSLKISLLSITLGALMLLLCGAVFLRAAYRQSLDAACGAARDRLRFFATSYAIAVSGSSEPMSERVEQSRRQYVFRQFDKTGANWMLTYGGAVLYNDSDLALDRLLGTEAERYLQIGDRYAYLAVEATDDGSAIYLLRDCTDLLTQAKQLTRLFVFVALGAFAVMTAGMLLLTRAALRPLKTLERAAKRIADGDYDTPVCVSRTDEIGSLAQSFEQMRRSIRAQIEAVSAVAEERKQLLGALTHELKTPMTAIIGYSEALETLRLSPTHRQESIAFIARESKRLEALTQKMMRLVTLTHGETIQKTPIRGETLFGLLEPMLAPLAAQRGVTLSLDLCGFSAAGDADLIGSVLVNLFDNAVSAGAKHVSVTGKGPILTVRDDGCGMRPEVLARVTEPFYRADKARSRAGGHAGLGLALVQRIIELHDGQLFFESAEGEGTTVTVRLGKTNY